MYYILL